MGKFKTIKKLISASLICVLAVGTLTGCGDKKDDGGDANGTADKKAEISIAMATDPDSLDASRADDAQKNQIILEVQETLLRIDENGEAQPAGAESWDISEDGKVYTFHLRANKYSNGEEVKAEDYVNAMIRTLDPEVGSHNAGTYYVIEGAENYNSGNGTKEEVGVKAKDDKTLEITLSEAIPYFIQMANTANLTPIPVADTEGANNTVYGSDATKMVYSGPFMIEKWARGEGITLVKNPNYWDADSVKLDKVNMLLVEEVNTRQQMFEQGQIDILEGLNAEYVELTKEKVEKNEIQMNEYSKPGNSYVCFNNNDPEGVFSNAKIRKAFSLAIDREIYIDKVLKKDEAAYGVIPPATNNGDTKFRDNVKDPLLADKDQDPKKLLEEGLKEIGKEGQQLTVTFLQGNANNDTKVKSEFFQNQWESKLGVTVKIDTAADNATFNAQVSKGLYQMCNTGWGADYNDPMTFMQLYVTGDGNNAPFASNEKYDQLINDCKTELDMKVREEKFAEAEKIVVQEQASIAPLSYSISKNLISSRLKGFSFNGAGGPTIELKTAFVE